MSINIFLEEDKDEMTVSISERKAMYAGDYVGTEIHNDKTFTKRELKEFLDDLTDIYNQMN